MSRLVACTLGLVFDCVMLKIYTSSCSCQSVYMKSLFYFTYYYDRLDLVFWEVNEPKIC